MTELDALPGYRQTLSKRLRDMDSIVDIELRGLLPHTYGGAPPMATLRSPYGYHRALEQVLDNVVVAEQEGYSAFAMASWVAPFLRAARSAVDIPVTSMAESALAVACSLGRRFVLVCINEDQARMVSELVEELNFDSRVVAVIPLDLALTEDAVASSFGSDGAIADSGQRAARAGIARGADVVIPAEGILSEVMRAEGIVTIDGAPVLDCIKILVDHTIWLMRLWQESSLCVGRIWSYPRPLVGRP
jgi:allantoin racemase